MCTTLFFMCQGFYPDWIGAWQSIHCVSNLVGRRRTTLEYISPSASSPDVRLCAPISEGVEIIFGLSHGPFGCTLYVITHPPRIAQHSHHWSIQTGFCVSLQFHANDPPVRTWSMHFPSLWLIKLWILSSSSSFFQKSSQIYIHTEPFKLQQRLARTDSGGDLQKSSCEAWIFIWRKNGLNVKKNSITTLTVYLAATNYPGGKKTRAGSNAPGVKLFLSLYTMMQDASW